MATLSAAVFSIAARFFSLVGVKASVLDNSPDVGVQPFPIMTNVFILMATYLACRHEVGAGITVLRVVGSLASLTECDALQAVLTCLKHFTTATLNAAVFSTATRFLTLMEVKASLLDKRQDARIPLLLVITMFQILRPAYLACHRELAAGITVFQEARPEENFGWFLQVLADMARVYGLTAAVVLCASLGFLIGTDVKVTARALVLHSQMMGEHRNIAATRRPKKTVDQKPPPGLMTTICIVVLWAAILEFVVYPLRGRSVSPAGRLNHAPPAATWGI
ncbi:hypothetical protein MTO96_035580 [Rhipicephalus appendiculatus]